MRPVTFADCFGWFHAPASGASRDAAVLLCPGLGQDLSTGHRPLRQLADALAAAGFPVLRFDYPGTGDSADIEPAACWPAWRQAVDAALDWLRMQAGARRLVVAGLRFGATLGALAATRHRDVAGLLLLAPVLKGRPYATQLAIEARLRGPRPEGADYAIEVGELRLTSETLGEMGKADLRALAMPPGCRVAVRSRAETQALAQCLEAWRAQGAAVDSDGFDGLEALLRPTHLTDEPDADFAGLVRWFDASFPAPEAVATRMPGSIADALHGDGWSERAVRFGAQDHLRGILCRPAEPARRDLAVVVANTGGNPHHGFARFSVELARTLARAGIACLRLDFAGLGDSVTPGGGLTHVFEVDRVPDMTAAVDLLQREGYRRFAAHGLCSGAYHALQAGIADPRYSRLVLVNLPWFTLRHDQPGPESAARRGVNGLVRRGAAALFLFSAGDAGLKPLARHFGEAGLALGGLPGMSVSVQPGLDHELTGGAMRAAVAAATVRFLLGGGKTEAARRRAAELSPLLS